MKKGLRLLRLGPSGSCDRIQKKYGDLSIVLQDEIKDLSEFTIRLYPRGTFDGYKKLKDNFYIYEIKKRNTFLSLIKTFFKVVYLTRKYRINVIHSNDPYFFALPLLTAARLMHIPFCVSIHADYKKRESLQGNVIPRFLGSLYFSSKIERYVYKQADLVLPIRESLKPHLVSAGCAEEKIRIFPHEVCFSDFQKPVSRDIRALYNFSRDAIIISYIARIEKENYCYDLIEIAVKCIAVNSNICFLVCGEGSELAHLRKRVDDLGLGKNIVFAGFVSHDSVVDIRKQSYINLCLMGGFSLIEACAASRPVISYDVEWHYELVLNDETGFLIKENNIDGVVDKVSYLVDNNDRADEMGKNALKLAFEKHSPDTVSQIKRAVYMELLGKYA